jgi:hypothetical protein
MTRAYRGPDWPMQIYDQNWQLGGFEHGADAQEISAGRL